MIPIMSQAPVNDVQQALVYGFEKDFVEPHAPAVMSREEIVELVLRASRLARIQAPEVVFGGDIPGPCLADVRARKLTIQVWGRNPTTILHEVAHQVTADDPEGLAEMLRGQAHGPQFLRNAIELYSDFIQIPRAGLERSATRFGLKVAPRRVYDAPPTAAWYDGEF
jgi:hypothetical protein